MTPIAQEISLEGVRYLHITHTNPDGGEWVEVSAHCIETGKYLGTEFPDGFTSIEDDIDYTKGMLGIYEEHRGKELYLVKLVAAYNELVNTTAMLEGLVSDSVLDMLTARLDVIREERQRLEGELA